MSPQTEVQVIAVLTAAACALPGTFLLLRRMAMLSDAISHSILPGIVLAFFLTHDLSSPWLVLAAAATGVLTVWLVQVVLTGGSLREDGAIGLVFPALFALGVLLISRYAGDVHLDLDAVLMGELAFAPFDRLLWNGRDLGPRALWLVLGLLALNAAMIALFAKELMLASFDAGLAALFGFSPLWLHYGFMAVVSTTIVVAFDAVGSILVIALMIGPPAAAYLWTDRWSRLLGLSVAIGAAAALSGYWLAHLLDASIAGAMATMVGVAFALSWLMAPQYGWIARWLRRRQQLLGVRIQLLLVHLLHHDDLPTYADEAALATLDQHLTWTPEQTRQVVAEAVARRLVRSDGGVLYLTDTGRQLARRAVVGRLTLE